MNGFELPSIDLGNAFLGGQSFGQGGYQGHKSLDSLKGAMKAGGDVFNNDNVKIANTDGLVGSGGNWDMDSMNSTMGMMSNLHGIYDGIWGSGAVKREYMQEGLAAMKDNRRLAQQTMQNNMTSYDNNLSRQMNGRASMVKGLAPDRVAPDQRQKLGQYDNKQKLA